MSAPYDPQHAFAELGLILLGEQSVEETLQRVAELAKETITAADEVSVTLMDGARPRTVVFTGSLAVQLDERQYELGFGPCTDAAMTGQTITLDHRVPGSAYPEFSAVAVRAGVHHTMSVGLPLPQRVVGALNIYRLEGGPADKPTIALAEAFAGYAAVAIANAALYSSTADLARNMQQAVQSRAVIDQAKGILMAHGHFSADLAFQKLVTTSQQQNRKLRAVAQAIVDGVQQGDSAR